MMNDGAVVDPRTGIAIPQQRLVSSAGMPYPRPRGVGTITYRCFSCGESIVKPWEVLFVDISPRRAYASPISPPKMSASMTTHHDWHMASTQRED